MRSIDKFDCIYLHREFVDMRKSINGLSVIVEQEMKLDPFSSCLFIFCNRRRDRLKILYWDRTGFALWLKRLEKDRFYWPKHFEDPVLKLAIDSLAHLLEGYPFWKFKPFETLHYAQVS